MRTRCVRVSREEKKFAGGPPPVALVEKAVESLARADDPFLSLSSRLFFCYAAPRSVNNGSTGESWRATTCLGCPAAAVLSALGRSVRAHRRRKKKESQSYPSIGPIRTDDIHYPLAAIPFAERVARLFF